MTATPPSDLASASAAGVAATGVADRLLAVGTRLAITGAAFVSLTYLVNALLFDERFYDLNAKAEGNVFTWLSTVATFAGAFVAFMHAVLFTQRRRQYTVLAAVLAFFSLDDLIRIHERVGEKFGREMLGLSKNIADQLEIVIFVPLFTATLLIGWQLARTAPARARRLLLIGLSLLVVSVVIEFVGVVTRRMEERTSTNWPNQVRVAVEEGMELAGWALVSTALAAVVSLALVEYGRSRATRSLDYE